MQLDRLLVLQDGVVTRTQARACGLADHQIAERVARGQWRRMARSVYLAVAWPFTISARVRVAGLWAGERGVLLGVTAAWWWGTDLVDDPRPLTVGLPRGASRRAPPGVRVVQREVGADRERHRGLWLVGRPLAVLDAAVALGARGRTVLDRALQRGDVSTAELRRAQSRHLGRRGSAAASRLLAHLSDRTASEAERRFVALLGRAGIGGWQVNLPIRLASGRIAILDVAFAAVRLAVEVDGWAFHQDADRFVGDRARKRELVAAGWTVVEVTWWELVTTPDVVVADLRRVLARMASGPGASEPRVSS